VSVNTTSTGASLETRANGNLKGMEMLPCMEGGKTVFFARLALSDS